MCIESVAGEGNAEIVTAGEANCYTDAVRGCVCTPLEMDTQHYSQAGEAGENEAKIMIGRMNSFCRPFMLFDIHCIFTGQSRKTAKVSFCWYLWVEIDLRVKACGKLQRGGELTCIHIPPKPTFDVWMLAFYPRLYSSLFLIHCSKRIYREVEQPVSMSAQL